MSVSDKVPQASDRLEHMQRFRSREAWHVLKIMAEFVESTEALSEISPAVSIFGSARTPRALPTLELNPAVDDIFGFAYDDIAVEGYDPWPALAAPIAV